MTTTRRRTAITPLPLPLPALCALLLAGSIPAVAAPPPGHPSPADAYRMMQSTIPGRTVAPAHLAEVVSAIDANEYTYVEVREGDRTRWIAGPKTALARGDTVRFDDGVVMTDFYSKLLQRTFPTVMFVSNFLVKRAGN